MNVDEMKGLLDGVSTAVKTASTKVDGIKTELEGSVKTLSDDVEAKHAEITAALAAQSQAIKDIKVVSRETDTTLDTVMKHISSEDFKTAIKNKKDFEFDVKFTLSQFSPHLLSQQVMPGIGATAIPEYLLTQMLPKGTISSRTLYYIDEVAYDWADPTVNIIGEGQAKPGVTTSFEEKSVSLIKFANSARVSSEVLWDASYVSSIINNTLLRDLSRQIEYSFIAGSGNNNFKGLGGYAVQYGGTDLDGTVASPGMAEALLAVALEMRLKGFNPDLIVLSPESYTQLQIIRDLNGNYIGQQVAAMLSQFTIVPTTRFSSSSAKAGLVPAGVFYMLDSTRYFAYNDGSITIRAGYNADDFITNRQSFVAEQRWLDFQYQRDAGSVVMGIFDDIIGQLTLIEP